MQCKDARQRSCWPGWTLGSILRISILRISILRISILRISVLLIAGCHSIQRADTQVDAQPEHPLPLLARGENLRAKGRFPTPVAVEKGAPAVPDQPIPISLDTVLRLAQDQNGQVRLARMKVEEAYSDQEMARAHWFPDISVGMGTWRHEGGIQDFQGNLIRSSYGSALAGLDLRGKYDWKESLFRRVEAERKFWQNKGELSKLTSENLLEASSAYIDLLAVRTGVAISLDTERRLNDLLTQAGALAKVDPGLRVEVTRVQTELTAQKVLTVKLRETGKGACAKLAYLLGLDPRCEIIIMDPQMVPIKLVDASQPVHAIVEHVLAHGPGVRELEGLLRTVEAARNSNYGWQHVVPSIELCMVEGGFAAGPGRQLDWANRFDMGVQLRWNLNEFLYAKYKRQQADMQIQQVHLTYEDLRAKLTLGVQEAREAILGGTEQMRLAEIHIENADESFKLSDQRLKQNIKGRSTSEVLLALRGLGGARLEFLQALRDFNKAQLRLYSLAGTNPGRE